MKKDGGGGSGRKAWAPLLPYLQERVPISKIMVLAEPQTIISSKGNKGGQGRGSWNSPLQKPMAFSTLVFSPKVLGTEILSLDLWLS